jgi:hypothetical protein
MPEELSIEEKQRRLEATRKDIAKLREYEEGLAKDLGQSGGGDVVATAERKDQDAEAFDRLTPKERMELYETNRARWEELIAAKEQAGMRRLLNTRPVP